MRQGAGGGPGGRGALSRDVAVLREYSEITKLTSRKCAHSLAFIAYLLKVEMQGRRSGMRWRQILEEVMLFFWLFVVGLGWVLCTGRPTLLGPAPEQRAKNAMERKSCPGGVAQYIRHISECQAKSARNLCEFFYSILFYSILSPETILLLL